MSAVGPLEGHLVIELARWQPAALVGLTLAGLGADVVKIEKRGVGDPHRGATGISQSGVDANFVAYNRGKRSVALSLDSPDGLDVFTRLVRRADVIVQDYLPHQLDAVGIDIDDLRRDNPAAVWCSVTSYGLDDELSHVTAYDMCAQARSGAMSLTGPPGGPPVLMGFTVGEFAGGLHGALAVVAALLDRTRTGEGALLDLSAVECTAALAGPFLQYQLATGMVHGFRGSADPLMPATLMATCADGHRVYVAAIDDRHFAALCEEIGGADLASDERFARFTDRRRNRDELNGLLVERISRVGRDGLLAALARRGVPAAPVNDMADVVDDPFLERRGLIAEASDGDGTTFRVPCLPVSSSSWARQPLAPAPYAADTTDVLVRHAGLDPADVRRLADAGVVDVR